MGRRRNHQTTRGQMTYLALLRKPVGFSEFGSKGTSRKNTESSSCGIFQFISWVAHYFDLIIALVFLHWCGLFEKHRSQFLRALSVMSSPYKLNISVDKIEVEKYRPKDIVCMNEWSLKGAKLYLLLFTINKNNITIKICSQCFIFLSYFWWFKITLNVT